MRERSFRVLVSVCFLLLLGVNALAQEYQRPKPKAGEGPPTYADLETYTGASHSLAVQLLNLTPYDIEFVHAPGVTWSITSADEALMQDQTKYSNHSFMFVPAGIPTLIGGAPAQNFLNPGDPGYDPNYEDATTHPYPMLFAWNDHAGIRVDNWVKWTVKGVRYLSCDNSTPPLCEYRYQDVGLGLWMYRIQPTSILQSALLGLIVDSLKAVCSTVRLTTEFTNPLAWIHEFLVIKELAEGADAFSKENSKENDGEKMWVASYVIPNPTSNCVRTNSGCRPATLTPAETGDAVYSQWTGTFAGPCSQNASGQWNCPYDAAEGMLVVSVHLLRGRKAIQCDPAYYPKICPLGSEPVVMVTVMRADDFSIGTLAGASPDLSSEAKGPPNKIRLFLLQAGAGRIRNLLQKQGRSGLLELRSLINGLEPAQQQVLREMIRTMGSGRLPTQQERQLVHSLADALKQRLK
ncbi:MAG: hypothetical protein LLG20_15795 [Acidobacteriales bacterium]|nr:hypothetical protein [Terriglobales bacterium]